jgi:hypothetical protein
MRALPARRVEPHDLVGPRRVNGPGQLRVEGERARDEVGQRVARDAPRCVAHFDRLRVPAQLRLARSFPHAVRRHAEEPERRRQEGGAAHAPRAHVLVDRDHRAVGAFVRVHDAERFLVPFGPQQPQWARRDAQQSLRLRADPKVAVAIAVRDVRLLAQSERVGRRAAAVARVVHDDAGAVAAPEAPLLVHALRPRRARAAQQRDASQAFVEQFGVRARTVAAEEERAAVARIDQPLAHGARAGAEHAHATVLEARGRLADRGQPQPSPRVAHERRARRDRIRQRVRAAVAEAPDLFRTRAEQRAVVGFEHLSAAEPQVRRVAREARAVPVAEPAVVGRRPERTVARDEQAREAVRRQSVGDAEHAEAQSVEAREPAGRRDPEVAVGRSRERDHRGGRQSFVRRPSAHRERFLGRGRTRRAGEHERRRQRERCGDAAGEGMGECRSGGGHDRAKTITRSGRSASRLEPRDHGTGDGEGVLPFEVRQLRGDPGGESPVTFGRGGGLVGHRDHGDPFAGLGELE